MEEVLPSVANGNLVLQSLVYYLSAIIPFLTTPYSICSTNSQNGMEEVLLGLLYFKLGIAYLSLAFESL